jgi:hypothetical protein
MPVPYEELANSPSFKIDRNGLGTCKREVKIGWTNIVPFVTEVLPNPFNGFGSAVAPLFPNMAVQDVDIVPFQPGDPIGDDGTGVNLFDYAKITVNYKNFTFVMHKITYSGEFITWPSSALHWLNPIARTRLIAAPLGGVGLGGGPALRIPQRVVVQDRSVGAQTLIAIIIPQIEHTYDYDFAVFPPFDAIRLCMGKVNAKPIGSAAAGTVLFAGCSVDQNITPGAWNTWNLNQATKLQYKMIEKNLNAGDAQTGQGWNYFLRPETGKFERMVRGIDKSLLAVVPLGGVPAPVGAAGITINLEGLIDDTQTTINRVGVATWGASRAAWAAFLANPPFLIQIESEILRVRLVEPLGPPPIPGFVIPDGQFVDYKFTVDRGWNGTKARVHLLNAAITIIEFDIYDSEDFDFQGLFSILPGQQF